MPKQPSASVFVDLPLPEPKTAMARKAESAEADEDPLDLQVNMEESRSRFTDDDTELRDVPEITSDDMELVMIDDELPEPEEDIENDDFLQLETDLEINPLGYGYVEAEDDFFLQDDEAAFAQLDQQMANEDEYLLLEADIHQDDVDHSEESFLAEEIGMAPLGVEYNRIIPEQYNEESPNRFMYLILT